MGRVVEAQGKWCDVRWIAQPGSSSHNIATLATAQPPRYHIQNFIIAHLPAEMLGPWAMFFMLSNDQL
jgi:hypothetical protein